MKKYLVKRIQIKETISVHEVMAINPTEAINIVDQDVDSELDMVTLKITDSKNYDIVDR